MARVFHERSRMPIWIAIMVGVFTVPLLLYFYYGIFIQFVVGEPFGTKPMSDFGLVTFTGGFTIFTGIMIWLIFLIEIKLKVMDGVIYFHFTPFVNQTRKYKIQELRNWSIQKRNAFFTGIGLRYDPVNKTTIYSTGSSHVLALELANGKKLMIATRRPMELKRFIEQSIVQRNE